MNQYLCASVLAVLSGVAHAADPKLNDFLVDIGPGHIAANEILGMGTAVSNLQTPKDLVAAINAAGDAKSKGGFAIAYSPGRSAFAPLAVPMVDYVGDKKPLARLWGSTTFSYAQNRTTLGGVDYAQTAVAVHVSYYFHRDDDPVVAGYNAIAKLDTSPCKPGLFELKRSMELLNQRQRELTQKREQELGSQGLSAEDRQKIKDQIKAEGVPAPEVVANNLPAMLKAAKSPNTKTASESDLLGLPIEVLRQCASDHADTVKAKWNASAANLVLGQGWIKSPTAGASRIPLGRHMAVAVAWGPKEMSNSLINLTLRRVDRELDLDTITTTPEFKRTNTLAARYTYGYGEGRKTYVLAEISNAKKGTVTLSGTAFKQALGLDHKLAEGIWLELRTGRAIASDGGKMENKTLFNLKFSPQTTLNKEVSG